MYTLVLGIVTVYRAGNHVDISRGPMITNTNLLGKTSIMSLHKITNTDTVSEGGQLYRLQGVALPKQLIMNHVAYGIVEERARQLVSSYIISAYSHSESDQRSDLNEICKKCQWNKK